MFAKMLSFEEDDDELFTNAIHPYVWMNESVFDKLLENCGKNFDRIMFGDFCIVNKWSI